MGVPVVTLQSTREPEQMLQVQNVGVSLLSAIGHPEWIARDEEHYIQIAEELASDPDRLVVLRSRLRSDMLSSPLCDQRAYLNHVTSILKAMWTEAGGRME